MTTLAFISCGLGLALAVFFEIAFAYVDKHWDIPADKDTWFIGIWSVVIAILICCDAMPLTPSGLFPWVPFFVVFIFHMLINSGDGSFSRRSNLPPSCRPTSTPPTPPVNPDGRDIQNVTKPKPNNNQKG